VVADMEVTYGNPLHLWVVEHARARPGGTGGYRWGFSSRGLFRVHEPTVNPKCGLTVAAKTTGDRSTCARVATVGALATARFCDAKRPTITDVRLIPPTN
jgi:hypothetical protein